ncbi:type IV pilus biogenesis/stability protein PilW [Colwelliaceae bacterium 6471]
MVKFSQFLVVINLLFFVSGCVTQNYEEGKKPVIENDANNNEIAMTRISLGLGYLKMGNTAQAKLNLEKAKRFAPNLVQVYTAFAHYYETVGEPELTSVSYEKALSLDADDADTLNNYGVFLCRQDRVEDAEKQFLKAIAIPSYILVAKSYENLALCHLKNNHFVKAETYFDKAVKHSPSSASILYQMMRLQYAKGDYKGAQGYLSRYEKSTRRFTPAALGLAYKIFDKQHNQRIAKNYAAMLIKMFPNSYESKQFILNELAHIDADELAKSYQLAHISKQPEVNSSKKRVVVLSPKKTESLITPKVASAPSAKQTEKATPKESQVAVQPKVVTTNKKETKPSVEQAASHDQTMMTIPIHVVVKGDSLFSISKTYNIHIKAIKRWNNIKKSNLLRIGDVIYLGDPKKAAKS